MNIFQSMLQVYSAHHAGNEQNLPHACVLCNNILHPASPLLARLNASHLSGSPVATFPFFFTPVKHSLQIVLWLWLYCRLKAMNFLSLMNEKGEDVVSKLNACLSYISYFFDKLSL